MNGKTGNVGDLAAYGIIGASWMDWLPYIATALTIVWLAIRIGDWIYAKFKPKE